MVSEEANRNGEEVMPSAWCIDHEAHPHRYGYKFIKYKGISTSAHRLAYCQTHGLELSAIEGAVIMHTCDNKRCINPDHLIKGTTR